jgi:hypothetical protein
MTLFPSAFGPTSEAIEVGSVKYRYWYNRGWRYSQRASAVGLEWGDAHDFPDAWYDGYLDLAAGRKKWHFVACRQAGGCEEHRYGGGPTIAEFVEVINREQG